MKPRTVLLKACNKCNNINNSTTNTNALLTDDGGKQKRHLTVTSV